MRNFQWSQVGERVQFVSRIALVTSLSGAVIACASVDDGATSKEQNLSSGATPQAPQLLSEFSSLDGVGNNQASPDNGATGTILRRGVDADYADGVGELSGQNRPSPRVVSNTVAAQSGPTPNSAGATDMFWLWGQFVDHDIDLSLESGEAALIPVPQGDAIFDPQGTGTQTIDFHRSASVTEGGVREQLNAISAYIDGTNIYGSDEVRADALRKLDGSGELKVSAGDLLPFNEAGLANAGGPSPTLFLAGDVRANEQVYLTAMHTLWVREHNTWARHIRAASPHYSGDQVYNMARAVVVGELQAIVYEEFLPMLLGEDALDPYAGYDPSVDASIGNEFSTAAYRFGHTMLSGSLLRLNADGSSIPAGPLTLRTAFFNPQALISGGLAPFLRGASGQTAQEIDHLIVDDVRNFLFSNVSTHGFDLPALNLQRGRDHGIADYNSTRVAYGLAPRTSFAQVSANSQATSRLAATYSSVNDMDLWMAGLAESHAAGAMVGETFQAIIADQFQRLRDGDRFYYENYLPSHLVTLVRHTKLSTIVRRNTDATITNLRHELMRSLPAAQSTLLGCESTGGWTATGGSLSSNTAYVTDGAASLNVSINQSGGVVLARSPRLARASVTGATGMTVDLFVPEEQPNAYWAGNLQAYLTCSSVGIYNAYLGQSELSDMPRGQFNTAEFSIPSETSAKLGAGANDCRVTFSLNANTTAVPYSLDRITFD